MQKANKFQLTPTGARIKIIPCQNLCAQTRSSQTYLNQRVPRSHPIRPCQLRIPLYFLSPFPFLTLDDLAPRLSNQGSLIIINKYASLLCTIILYICCKSLFQEADQSLVSRLLIWLAWCTNLSLQKPVVSDFGFSEGERQWTHQLSGHSQWHFERTGMAFHGECPLHAGAP